MTETLLDGAAETPLSDPGLSLTRGEVARLAAGIRAHIADEGLEGARFCLALDSTLGSLAMLAGLLESDASVALIPRPTDGSDPDWPGFVEAGLTPPDAAAGAGTLGITRLKDRAASVTGLKMWKDVREATSSRTTHRQCSAV